MFYYILERKNAFLGFKNNKFKKSKNWHFSKTLGFGQKVAIFPSFFFWQYRPGNVFYDILERKNAFLEYKNKKLNSTKIDIFPKGLTHVFGQKLAILLIYFFKAI